LTKYFYTKIVVQEVPGLGSEADIEKLMLRMWKKQLTVYHKKSVKVVRKWFEFLA
jgi:hypothetical protein